MSALKVLLVTLLLIHLGVLTVRGLGVTAVVTIGTVVRIAVGGSILSHAFRKTWTLRAVLRSSSVARGSGLVPDRRQLRVLRRLTRHTNCLAHLPINRSLTRSTAIVDALLDVGAVSLLIGLARSLFFLLLCFPLLANFFKFYVVKLA